MKKIGKPRYTVVNPCLAEQLHGLPKNWTKATFSEHSKVKKLIKHNEDRLRGASLFSGVGALDKGLEHAIDVKLYYEKDAAARRVLQSLIHKGMLSPGEIHGDVANAEAKDHLCIYYAFIFCIYLKAIAHAAGPSFAGLQHGRIGGLGEREIGGYNKYIYICV